MKPVITAFLLLFLLKSNGYSQSLSEADLKGFTLNWEIVDNSLTDGQQSKSVLTLTNNSTKPLPANRARPRGGHYACLSLLGKEPYSMV